MFVVLIFIDCQCYLNGTIDGSNICEKSDQSNGSCQIQPGCKHGYKGDDCGTCDIGYGKDKDGNCDICLDTFIVSKIDSEGRPWCEKNCNDWDPDCAMACKIKSCRDSSCENLTGICTEGGQCNCTISCDGDSSCQDLTVISSMGVHFYINCNEGYSCQGLRLVCNNGGKCSLNCNGVDSCQKLSASECKDEDSCQIIGDPTKLGPRPRLRGRYLCYEGASCNYNCPRDNYCLETIDLCPVPGACTYNY